MLASGLPQFQLQQLQLVLVLVLCGASLKPASAVAPSLTKLHHPVGKSDAQASSIAVQLSAGESDGGRLLGDTLNMPRLELLSSSHLENFQHSWQWEMRCVESKEEVIDKWHKTSDQTNDFSGFDNRAGRACFPPSSPTKNVSAGREKILGPQCFRAVHDGKVFSPADAEKMLETLLRDGFRLSNSAQADAFEKKVVVAFEELHGVKGLHLVSLDYISTTPPAEDFHGTPGDGKLHMDFKYTKRREAFIYSALLYLSDATPAGGGSTAFVDDAAATYVYPSKGRLVLFTGGFENLHGAMPLLRADSGHRALIAAWFDCDHRSNMKNNPHVHVDL